MAAGRWCRVSIVAGCHLLAAGLTAGLFNATPLRADDIVAALPKDAVKRLSQGQTRRGYEEAILDLLRWKSRKADSTRLVDVESAIRFAQAGNRAYAISSWFKFDADGDRVVTEAEVQEITQFHADSDPDLLKPRPNAAQETMGILLKYDADHDRRVTLSEIQSFDWSKSSTGYHDAARALFAFDPNSDGVLEKAEVFAIADRAFDAVDEDHDGKLNADEARKVPHGN